MGRYPDVLVIGGGIIGLTSAYFLAKARLTVEVIDKGDLGREASWAGAGIIPPGRYPERTTTPIDRLRAYSVSRFAEFAAELREVSGIDTEYHVCGGVDFLSDDELPVTELWEREGIPFRRLAAEALAKVAPGVQPVAGRTPVWLGTMAQVRNPRLLASLIAASRHRDVRLNPHTPFGRWEREGNRVVAVMANGVRKPAGAYLIAAGAWAEELLSPLDCRPKVHPVRGQIVLFNPGCRIFRPILQVGKRYLVSRQDGRVLAGSTEEPEAGFVEENTPAGVRGLIDFACVLVPMLADVEVEKCWAGLRPGSSDGMPFIGPVPGHDNVFAAVGHFRAGIQLSLGTAEIVTNLIRRAPLPFPIDAFRLDREPDLTTRPAFLS